jgi:hypothetical protein
MACDQSGQGVLEYLLVLVVAVGVILGGIYRLNMAFKTWANNYFGNYLACLLETGELPTLGGPGGDSGICNQIFKPFSLADGRPLLNGYQAPESKSSGGAGGGGSRESRGSGGGGGGGAGYSGTPFRASLGAGSQRSGRSGRSFDGSGASAGNKKNGDQDKGSASRNGREKGRNEAKLDNRFAFEDERQPRQQSRAPAVSRKSGEGKGKPKRFALNRNAFKKNAAEAPSSSFTISDFIRFLIIAAIIIALVLFLGGQALNIGKSMDGG